MDTKKPPKNSLFSRIIILLLTPLLLLATVLTALQVSIQLNSLNKIQEMQSRSAFDEFEQQVRNDFNKLPEERDLSLWASQFSKKITVEPVQEVSFFDYLKTSAHPPESRWEAFDLAQIESSLDLHKNKGKKQHVALDRQKRLLLAYVPLARADGSALFIARASVPLSDFKEAIRHSKLSLLIMLFVILGVGSLIGYNLSKAIIRPIQLLNKATQDIARGKLGEQVKIKTGDEIEILAQTFNEMSRSLAEMQQKAVDSNPLTELPGNQGIFKELKKRIFERQKFVLFHADLDRFKVFNDHYGLAKGDAAIKLTADVLKKTVSQYGAHDDFVGHQGGDDFIIITRPQRAETIARKIVEGFDQTVAGSLYSREDTTRGFTEHEDRRYFTETGVSRKIKFPLLAISLAGVSTAKKDLADYFQCMTLATNVKKEAKKNEKSSFIIEEDF